MPRFELPNLLKEVKQIGKKYGFESICYGHAGDGNLHVNILKGNLSDEKWDNELNLAIRELFEKVVALGGTISGEHGIGSIKQGFAANELSPAVIELQRSIKRAFDPKGILNPGKKLP